MLIDSHCHLDFPDFDADRAEVIARARRAGVGAMLTICTHLSRFAPVLALAEQHAEVACTVGVHPHNAGEELAAAPEDRLVALAAHPRVLAFGETGLDFFYDHSPRAAQEESFRRHIRAARRTGLPLVIHTRDADEATVRVLREEAQGAPLAGLIHCFSGDADLAQAALALGLSISVSGIATFKKAEALRQAIAGVPLDRLLVETDAPYLAPMPHRGKRNEPALVVHTAAELARVKGVSAEDLARQTTANFFRLFPRAAGVLPCG
jgi:TatD DNase family protein